MPAAKMRALLAYLAAAPRSAETRRRMAGLLWESSGEDQARQSLRQLLSNFRRGAAPKSSGILLFDDTTVSLDLSLVWIDRASLMEVRPDADLAELSRVADLYRNDFGLGLELGEPDFDGWLHGERIKVPRCGDIAVRPPGSGVDQAWTARGGVGARQSATPRSVSNRDTARAFGGWPAGVARRYICSAVPPELMVDRRCRHFDLPVVTCTGPIAASSAASKASSRSSLWSACPSPA
jgi:hypothetical protein